MIHSTAGGHDSEKRNVLAARNFAMAARAAGVRRILYLGGLGDPDTVLSGHLRSRQETGAVPRELVMVYLDFNVKMSLPPPRKPTSNSLKPARRMVGGILPENFVRSVQAAIEQPLLNPAFKSLEIKVFVESFPDDNFRSATTC